MCQLYIDIMPSNKMCQYNAILLLLLLLSLLIIIKKLSCTAFNNHPFHYKHQIQKLIYFIIYILLCNIIIIKKPI